MRGSGTECPSYGKNTENDWQKHAWLVGLLVLRRIVWLACLLLLMWATVWCWNHRYETVPGQPVLTLEDLRKLPATPPKGASWDDAAATRLRLHKQAGDPHVIWVLPLAAMKPMEALHLRVSVEARNLPAGKMDWDEGRVLIQWQSGTTGANEEFDHPAAVRDDQKLASFEQIVRPKSGNSRPILRFEHLGVSGDFLIHQLELTPVRSTAWWKRAAWILPWLWLGLVTVTLCRSNGSPHLVRCIAGAALWLGMILVFAIPGPWKSLRPLVGEFVLGVPPTNAAEDKADSKPASPADSAGASVAHGKAAPTKAEPKAPEPPTSAGRLHPNGGWLVEIKMKLLHLRPVLHALMLFAPTLCFAVLFGRKAALWLGATIMLCIESAQTAFGFGFDWKDILDLLTNGIGIVAAVWVYQHWLLPRFKRDVSANAPGDLPSHPEPLR